MVTMAQSAANCAAIVGRFLFLQPLSLSLLQAIDGVLSLALCPAGSGVSSSSPLQIFRDGNPRL